MRLTEEETKAIAALKRVAKDWPESLWVFSGSGTLWVMKKRNGQRAITSRGGFDQDCCVASILIENDGGDWD